MGYIISEDIKEAILNEFCDELSDRDYEYDRYVVRTILEKEYARKAHLFDILSKHPNWNPEKLMIQFDQDFTRKIETNEVWCFSNYLLSMWEKENNPLDEKFETNEAWLDAKFRVNQITSFIGSIKEQFFNEYMEQKIKDINTLNDQFMLRTNMKSSKAIGKICREEGWDKYEDYNRRYAALCDCLNPLCVKRHTCISLNPLDYLLMSNGTSWKSCHYIDSADGDPGCYSSGTISYLLDDNSFIFYTVDASYDGEYIELQKKTNRQVFAYKDGAFLQSRLYPQSNDSGAEHIYAEIRAIVQKVIADCSNEPNLWIRTKDAEDHIIHGYNATCYPDWNHCNPGGEHCSISRLKILPKDRIPKIIVGAHPICIKCGELHNVEENINCCSSSYKCWKCGYHYDKEDMYNFNGYWYCEECTIPCSDCGDRMPKDDDDIYYVEDDPYCEWCFHNRVEAHECECCGDYFYDSNMVFTADDSCYCESCAEDRVMRCEKCGDRYEECNLIYDEETDMYYCPDCYDELLEEREEEDNE